MKTHHHLTGTLALLLLAAPLAACGKNDNNNQQQSSAQTAPAEQTATADNSAAAPAAPAQTNPAPAPAQSAQNTAPPPPQSEPAPPPPPPAAAHDQRARRLAAQDFETLAREADTAKPHRLNALVDRARRNGRSARPDLSHAEWRQLRGDLDRLNHDHPARDRGRIQQAARDGYRVLTGRDLRGLSHDRDHARNDHGDRHAGRVPNGVETMDRAGENYRATLQHRPTRWHMAEQHADKVQAAWQDLHAQVHDRALTRDTTDAVRQMKRAARRHDAHQARQAARDEQQQVNKLEDYFRHSG